jgi:hypothetical protein
MQLLLQCALDVDRRTFGISLKTKVGTTLLWYLTSSELLLHQLSLQNRLKSIGLPKTASLTLRVVMHRWSHLLLQPKPLTVKTVKAGINSQHAEDGVGIILDKDVVSLLKINVCAGFFWVELNQVLQNAKYIFFRKCDKSVSVRKTAKRHGLSRCFIRFERGVKHYRIRFKRAALMVRCSWWRNPLLIFIPDFLS